MYPYPDNEEQAKPLKPQAFLAAMWVCTGFVAFMLCNLVLLRGIVLFVVTGIETAMGFYSLFALKKFASNFDEHAARLLTKLIISVFICLVILYGFGFWVISLKASYTPGQPMPKFWLPSMIGRGVLAIAGLTLVILCLVFFHQVGRRLQFIEEPTNMLPKVGIAFQFVPIIVIVQMLSLIIIVATLRHNKDVMVIAKAIYATMFHLIYAVPYILASILFYRAHKYQNTINNQL